MTNKIKTYFVAFLFLSLLILSKKETVKAGPGHWQWDPHLIECTDSETGWTMSYGAVCLRSPSGACVPNLCPSASQ